MGKSKTELNDFTILMHTLREWQFKQINSRHLYEYETKPACQWVL